MPKMFKDQQRPKQLRGMREREEKWNLGTDKAGKSTDYIGSNRSLFLL